MDSEDTLYFRAWVIIGTVISIFILSVTAYEINRTIQINDALVRNLDPTTVACAFNTITDGRCIIRAMPQ